MVATNSPSPAIAYHRTMKTLLVMRHAKSSWDNPRQTDHERPLNDRGRKDAPFMAARIAALELNLAAVVSSDATRAHETAEAVADELSLPLSTTPNLYHATVDDWRRVVAGFDAGWSGAIGVAHNPGIGELLLRLGGDGHVPTACVLHLRLPSWDGLLDAELVDVLKP